VCQQTEFSLRCPYVGARALHGAIFLEVRERGFVRVVVVQVGFEKANFEKPVSHIDRGSRVETRRVHKLWLNLIQLILLLLLLLLLLLRLC
jgi:hypothetical protein